MPLMTLMPLMPLMPLMLDFRKSFRENFSTKNTFKCLVGVARPGKGEG
jgi:hypothetical protein